MGNFYRLRPGDERAYEALAEVAKVGVTEFVKTSPFDWFASLFGSPVFESVLQKFVPRAERYIRFCSLESATIIVRCAIIPQVRATPAVSLASQIRDEVFDSLQRGVFSLTSLKWNLNNVDKELRVNSIHNPAKVREWPLLLDQAEAVIIQAVKDYLDEIPNLTERLLDFSYVRCFGGNISLVRKQATLESVRYVIAGDLARASKLILPQTRPEKAKLDLK